MNTKFQVCPEKVTKHWNSLVVWNFLGMHQPLEAKSFPLCIIQESSDVEAYEIPGVTLVA